MSRFKREQKYTYRNTKLTVEQNSTGYSEAIVASFAAASTTPLYPTQGTDYTNRFGRKIQGDKIKLNCKVNINHQPLIDRRATLLAATPSDPAASVDWFVNLRCFLIEHDEDLELDTPTKCYNWFRNTFTYFFADALYDCSNWNKQLRMSTAYTGKFRILYDKFVTLKSTKPQQIIQADIDLKGHTFDFNATTTVPPNGKQYTFIFLGPLSDGDQSMFFKLVQANGTTETYDDAITINCDTNLKFTYYDN